jgi:hypothetical protein
MFYINRQVQTEGVRAQGTEDKIWKQGTRNNRKCRKDRIEKLHDLHCLPNIIKMIKSRKIRWVEHEICLAKASNAQRVLRGET